MITDKKYMRHGYGICKQAILMQMMKRIHRPLNTINITTWGQLYTASVQGITRYAQP